MASPNSTFTELVTSTFRKVRKDVKDNLSNRNALLKHIYKRGNYPVSYTHLDVYKRQPQRRV